MLLQNVVAPTPPWSGIENYVQSYNPAEMWNLIPALLLPWPVIAMMVSIFFYVPDEKKIWSLIALSIIIVYAVMAATNYFIQLVAVQPAIYQGEVDGLTMFVGFMRPSVFRALANAYAVQSLGLLFAAFAFTRDGRELWLRRAWIAVGLTAPVQVVVSLDLIPLAVGILALAIWVIGVPIGCFILASLFRKSPNT